MSENNKVYWVVVSKSDEIKEYLYDCVVNKNIRVVPPLNNDLKRVICSKREHECARVVVDGVSNRWGFKRRSLVKMLTGLVTEGSFRFNGMRHVPKATRIIVLSTKAPWELDEQLCERCGAPFPVVNRLDEIENFFES